MQKMMQKIFSNACPICSMAMSVSFYVRISRRFRLVNRWVNFGTFGRLSSRHSFISGVFDRKKCSIDWLKNIKALIISVPKFYFLKKYFTFDSKISIFTGVLAVGGLKFSLTQKKFARRASWGTGSKNLTLGRTIFFQFSRR